MPSAGPRDDKSLQTSPHVHDAHGFSFLDPAPPDLTWELRVLELYKRSPSCLDDANFKKYMLCMFGTLGVPLRGATGAIESQAENVWHAEFRILKALAMRANCPSKGMPPRPTILANVT